MILRRWLRCGFWALRWCVNFQFCHKQKVQDTEALVVLMNYQRAPRWRMRNEIRMTNQEGAPIAHMDRERPERRRVMNISKLLDGHNPMIPRKPMACPAISAVHDWLGKVGSFAALTLIRREILSPTFKAFGGLSL